MKYQINHNEKIYTVDAEIFMLNEGVFLFYDDCKNIVAACPIVNTVIVSADNKNNIEKGCKCRCNEIPQAPNEAPVWSHLKMTKKQLKFYDEYKAKWGFHPSRDEITLCKELPDQMPTKQ